MSAADDIVARLATAAGISPGFTDAYGRWQETSLDTRRALLGDMGLPTASEDEARDSLGRVERLRTGVIPALIIVEAGRPTRIVVRPPAGADSALWRITAENRIEREGRASLTSAGDGQAAFELHALPHGYHRLTIETGRETAVSTIIAAPPQCWLPSELGDDRRLWGVTAQVYGLRSARNFGIGDFTDVAEVAGHSGDAGASFLGLSPLHALFAADRSKYSPYSPSSRLFVEPLYIDVTAVEGFAGSEAARLPDEPEFRKRLAEAREGSFVDYQAVWALKRRVLDALWQQFQAHGDHTPLAAFGRRHGDSLKGHATFEALSERFWAEGRHWIGEWPEPYRDAHSAEVSRFMEENAERVAFHAWLQFEADRQLGRANARAHATGMTIGLYRDLAVGADRGGSEVWANPERFMPASSVGAPPDLLAPNGQNWGLPPFNPLTLEEQGLAAFRALVVSNMRHSGAIRIDHAFQLRRLFLIPPGAKAGEGAYVEFPFEAMLAVLRVESHRRRALVIAEDLGTAPEGFSDAIMASGVLSYRVLHFERGPNASFKAPGTYPRRALAVVSTHDLPTFRGWWRGLDVDLKQTLGLYDVDQGERERAARVPERTRLAEALAAEHLLMSPEPPDEPPLEAAVRYLARTPSMLAGLQLEDAAGEINQANIPGSSEGVPNWRRRLPADLDALFAPAGEFNRLAAAFASEGRSLERRSSPLTAAPPRATYRFQFHKDFTFADAAAAVPYLARLGVSHVYASPILQARPGSTHGYDIVNHTVINPELGGDDGFYALATVLKEHGLGLILDIVPNHMGVGGADNGWWLSTLEWGEVSPAARYFDIDWGRLGAGGKIVVPFLGDRYGDALENGRLKLAFDPQDGSFSVWHYEHRFPVCPLQYPMILERAVVAMPEAEAAREALAVSERLRAMGEETAAARRAGFPREAEELKRRLKAAVEALPALAEGIEHAVTLLNGTPGVPESFGTLHRILEAQAYRLAYWRVAASDINYRRFFDVNSLAGLRMEEPELFEAAHETIFRLAREGHIQGLRIDHIDGLADPEGYARALQEALGPGFYVVVEKILEPGEELRANWPVAGTTGYETLNLLDGVFVDRANAERFERLYRGFTGLEGSYARLLREAKTEILLNSFSSELEVLVSDLKRVADADRHTRDFTVLALRRALAEIVAAFPVYRTYVGDGEPAPEDRAIIEGAVDQAKRRSELPDRSVHDFIAAALLNSIAAVAPSRPDPEGVARFRRRFQQLTGPVMAKSLEDTLFYRYVRLLSLCEVGGDPGHFGVSPEDFHEANAKRAKQWPHALVASATHDTKRGEDARARLNALSELPDDWAEALARWREIAGPHLRDADGEAAPDANDQYMLLQTLLGSWPMELIERTEPDVAASWRARLEGYVVKALREAKRHTSWVDVREPYEQAALGLLRRLLEPGSGFLDAFRPLARRLAAAGMLASLARTALKCTVPGVPDVYQGTELWDLSLVDPDNRRPVDYGTRARALDDNAPAGELLARWPDGRIKEHLLARLLAHRAAEPALYAQGGYEPLGAQGPRAANLLGFVRSHAEKRLVVVVPRLVAGALGDGLAPPGDFWNDTAVAVPAGSYRDLLTGAAHDAREHDGAARLGIRELFAESPIAVLAGEA